jgi:hypothetical protein
MRHERAMGLHDIGSKVAVQETEENGQGERVLMQCVGFFTAEPAVPADEASHPTNWASVDSL